MEFYLILAVATAVISGLTVLMWRKTQNIAFPLGVGLMYFWTLYGGWRIVRSLDGSSDEIPYLFYKVVPVFLNADYMMALLLYTLFIVTVQITVLYIVVPQRRMRATWVIEISHWRIAAMAAVAGIFGYLLIRNTLVGGTEENVSAYRAVHDASLYTVYEILSRAAMTLVSIGLAVRLSGNNPRYFRGRGRFVLIPYAAIFGGLIYLCMKTGNRTEAALAFALLVLFYSANSQRANKLLIGCAAGFGGIVLIAIKLVRDGFFTSATRVNPLDMWTAAQNELLRSTESIAAHLSMYGVLHKQLTLTYGSSLVSLVASLVPKAIWPNRPSTVYDDYVLGMAAVEGQGYTIHHATGWYMNFGVPGVIIGAFLMGWVWAALFNQVYQSTEARTGIGQIFSTIGFWTFSSAIPLILRAGPEVYKVIFFESLLIPTLLIAIASTTMLKQYNRPSLKLVRHLPARSFESGGPTG